MILTPKCCFIHVPKTGGTWVRNALKAAVSGTVEYSVNGDFHIGHADCPTPGLFKFAFVRDPLTWFPSYWRHKSAGGWFDENELDRRCKADSFPQFLRNVIERYPGVYSEWVRRAVGAPLAVDFVGAFGYLVDELIHALETAGEQFDRDAILRTPPANVGDRFLTAQISYFHEWEIRRTEDDIYSKFGYFL